MTERLADLLLTNGPIFGAGPGVSAVAVTRGTISYAGPVTGADGWTGPDTEIVDLDGRLVCPGFQDAHVHPIYAGLQLLRCDLEPYAALAPALEAIRRYAAANDEPWVRGGGWQFPWFPGGTPAASLLDELVGDRPAYLEVADGHAGWANSAALAIAGITAATADPPDGRIERLADGSPQGTLQEGAMKLVERVIPADTPVELDRALAAGQRRLFSHGVTAWQDAIVTPELHAAYLRAEAAGTLAARVRGALWWERDGGLEQLDRFEAQRAEAEGPQYVVGTVKLMLDGVCENHTARVLEPYAGGATGTGIDFIDPFELPRIVTEVMRRGFQPHFHAIGDAAVRNALDAVAAARAALGPVDVRPHVAHLQLVHPDDVPRFAELGVTANLQPLWACLDDAMTELTLPFLSPEQAKRQYPFGDLAAAGARLAMGSDWPVSSPDVMAQVAVAATRSVPGRPGTEPFLPAQRISVEAALAGFTAGSAYVNFLDADSGDIVPGMRADLVVLDGDPLATDDPGATRVDLTIVGGEVVHRR